MIIPAPKLPLFPRFRGEWTAQLVVELDKWVQELRSYLVGSPAQSIVDITFRAGDLPQIRFGSVMPIGVFVVGFDRLDEAGPVSEPMTAPLQWKWNNGTLSLPSLSAVSGTDQYRARVVVLEVR